jgi:poly(3-hydroxyalkanoate) synthetase
VSASWLDIARATAETGWSYWHRALAGGQVAPLLHAQNFARWLQLTSTRQPPGWHTPNRVVRRTAATALRDFSVDRPTAAVPTLLLPPQAGHHSCIIDYSPHQSQVSVAIEAGLDRLYGLEWLPATRDTKDCTVEDYLDAIDDAIDEAGDAVNLVGDCQGGWLAALYTALRPDRVASLTIAGAPIDFHAGDGPLRDYVAVLSPAQSLDVYRSAVRSGNGILRGELLIGGFIALKPELEYRKHLELLLNLDDEAFVARYTHFEDWYKHPHDLPGAFYLWIVEHLFVGNRLIDGTLAVRGTTVDLRKITCPVTMIGGTTDHITPPEQVFALSDHVGTPEAERREILVDAGHLGLFMSRAALTDHWLPTFRAMAATAPGSRRTRVRTRARTPAR